MERIKKYSLLCVALLICLGYLLSVVGATSPASQNRNPARKGSTQQEPKVRDLYARNCAKCHGADGRGKTEDAELAGVPDFASEKWQERARDERLAISITHGRGLMPSFKKKLSKREITALIIYVRAFKESAR